MKILKFHKSKVRYTQFVDKRVFLTYVTSFYSSKYEKKVIFMCLYLLYMDHWKHIFLVPGEKIPKLDNTLVISTLFGNN